MSRTSDDRGTVLQALSRRDWYTLEARHTAMVRARLVVVVALAITAAVAPLDMSAGERLAAVGACVLAGALHLALAALPARWPKRLLLAVDVALVVDAALVLALARASGGTDSLALWLLPLLCLAASLALDPAQGVKALALSALAAGAVDLWDPSADASLRDTGGPLAMALAVVVVAAITYPLNQRLLEAGEDRAHARRDASVALVGAEDAGAVRAATAAGARLLLPGWEVEVRLGGGDGAERTWRQDGRAWLAMPLVAEAEDAREDGRDEGERPLGEIVCSRPLAGRGSTVVGRKDVNTLRALARDASAALVQVEVREGLERLSMSDPLTSLGNRRAFDEALTSEMARARRSGGSMGVVMLDVDHFKQFNDRHGHQAGDAALIGVARVLAREARAEDRACRIGGEEFALLLPGADQDAAAAVAERVRRAVERGAGTAEPLTVSLGVAAVSRDGDPHDLVATADARLYAAKASGRNRVIAS